MLEAIILGYISIFTYPLIKFVLLRRVKHEVLKLTLSIYLTFIVLVLAFDNNFVLIGVLIQNFIIMIIVEQRNELFK